MSAVFPFIHFEECDDDFREDDALTLPEEIEPIVSRWLPPHMIMMDDQESAMLRITSVDGAFQIYGHEVKDKYKIKSMKSYFDSIYTRIKMISATNQITVHR